MLLIGECKQTVKEPWSGRGDPFPKPGISLCWPQPGSPDLPPSLPSLWPSLSLHLFHLCISISVIAHPLPTPRRFSLILSFSFPIWKFTLNATCSIKLSRTSLAWNVPLSILRHTAHRTPIVVYFRTIAMAFLAAAVVQCLFSQGINMEFKLPFTCWLYFDLLVISVVYLKTHTCTFQMTINVYLLL